jgi:hypothetical protein
LWAVYEGARHLLGEHQRMVLSDEGRLRPCSAASSQNDLVATGDLSPFLDRVRYGTHLYTSKANLDRFVLAARLFLRFLC